MQVDTGAAYGIPGDAIFLGIDQALRDLSYTVPLSGDSLEFINFSRADNVSSGTFQLTGMRLSDAVYGFQVDEEGLKSGPWVSYTGRAYTLAPPSWPRNLCLYVEGITTGLRVSQAGTVITYQAPQFPSSLYLNYASLGLVSGFPLELETDATLSTVLLSADSAMPALSPLLSDPGLILEYPQSQWRDSRYELFSWADFPSILILDSADYAIQSAFFKRLAFFVEKTATRAHSIPTKKSPRSTAGTRMTIGRKTWPASLIWQQRLILTSTTRNTCSWKFFWQTASSHAQLMAPTVRAVGQFWQSAVSQRPISAASLWRMRATTGSTLLTQTSAALRWTGGTRLTVRPRPFSVPTLPGTGMTVTMST
jgi:hypothetical protein